MKNYLLGAFVVLLLASCVDVSGSGSASATKKEVVPSYAYKTCRLAHGTYTLTIRGVPIGSELRVGQIVSFDGVITRLGFDFLQISILERGILNITPQSDGAGWDLLSASDCSDFHPSSTTVAPLGAYYLVVHNLYTPNNVRYSAKIDLTNP